MEYPATRRLAEQLPKVTFWYGPYTHRWWAITWAFGRCRLIQAATPADLATAVDDPAWPWPKEAIIEPR
jgi:hypothetical protein